MAKIECCNLSKMFNAGGDTFEAVSDLSFSVQTGELVSVVGRTGCGKSSTLHMVLGLERPTSGSITIDDKEPYTDFGYFRGRLAAVFQTDRLLPWRKTLDNVAYGLEILRVPEPDRRTRAQRWLERVGLGGFENAYPHQLSGGMRQRVGIARAFCVEPEVVLCDEAFGHLDEVTATQLRGDFLELVRETRKTSVFITHDIDEAIELGNRVLVLGKPARLLMDLTISEQMKKDLTARDEMKTRILNAIEANRPVG
jgi:NitT/TauT family transport system ATP-binding protein